MLIGAVVDIDLAVRKEEKRRKKNTSLPSRVFISGFSPFFINQPSSSLHSSRLRDLAESF